MKLNEKILWVFFFLMPLLVVNVFAYETDDYVPEITAKVSRISYLTGDVKIRRDGGYDWERAVQNLPIVEGDEIATDANALLEIQFDRDNYVRLAQNSYLKIVNLSDQGVALSISQGSLSVRVLNFEKDEKYFEIDAPSTTVSIQKEGMYRIDAGTIDSREIRVSVTENGQARVYSTNSGFTLKDGRSARIYIKGDLEGEWEMADASRYFDEFDEWSMKRDALIAKRLKDAYYDKYYDRDIYGAEDLNDFGEWIYTRDYGYVWKPYGSSISVYDDWSPYRYGHWRWVPPYGWTWVNDEPWGWATYHYGRWVYYNGYWVWTPYEYYRPRRSWWSPALVVIASVGNDVCWYPLPHRSHYRRYDHRDRKDGNRNNPPIASNPNPPVVSPTPIRDSRGKKLEPNAGQTFRDIPQTAVVSVPISDFGRNARGFKTAPPDTAKEILSKDPNDVALLLPTYRDLNSRVSREIRAEKPPVVKTEPNFQIGATTRSKDAPLDKELRERQFFGNRTPIENKNDNQSKDAADASNERNEKRRTGAVNRPTFNQNNEGADDSPVRSAPQQTFPSRTKERKSNGSSDQENQSPPVSNEPRREEPKRREETRQSTKQEERREEPKRQEQPRYEAPRREEPQRREEPKYEPPQKSEPRNDPPPQKSEPKDESKPSPPAESRSSKKDG